LVSLCLYYTDFIWQLLKDTQIVNAIGKKAKPTEEDVRFLKKIIETYSSDSNSKI